MNTTLHLPIAYIETSTWNRVDQPGGSILFDYLRARYRLAYSDVVVQEIAKESDSTRRGLLLKTMADFGAIRLHFLANDWKSYHQSWELGNPLGEPSDAVESPALTALSQKLHGGQREATFVALHEGLIGEVRQAVEVLGGDPGAEGTSWEAEAMAFRDSLERSFGDGIGFNGREEFQAKLKINPAHLSSQAIRPPKVLTKIQDYLAPRFAAVNAPPDTLSRLFAAPSNVTSVPGDPLYVYDRCAPLYTILNFVGFAADFGLTKDHRISGSQRDGMHVAWGALCPLFVTCDERLHRKAFAIYEALGKTTAVLATVGADGVRLRSDW